VERMHLAKDDPDTLVVEMTIEDPEALEKPWNITHRYTRSRDAELIELICAENDRNPVDEHGFTQFERSAAEESASSRARSGALKSTQAGRSALRRPRGRHDLGLCPHLGFCPDLSRLCPVEGPAMPHCRTDQRRDQREREHEERRPCRRGRLRQLI